MPSPCIDPSALAAWCSGRLGQEARSQLDRHVDTCDACRELMAAAGRVCASASSGSIALTPADSLGVDILALSELLTTPLGRYRVLDVVGGGGMGVVLAAWDDLLARQVAIKALRRAAAQNDETLRREAKALAALSDPRVVSVFDVVEQAGRQYLVMELVAGQTLREWQADAQPSDIVAAYVNVAHGLAAVHAAGLVHCDIKPDNVLVASDGRVLLADFGFAVLADPKVQRRQHSGGTPRYMAPEQRSGQLRTPAADQYGLCASLCEALTGTLPPEGVASAPRWIRSTLLRGLSEAPEHRWPSSLALAHALSRRPRTRRIAGAGALAVGAAAVYLSTAVPNATAPPLADPTPTEPAATKSDVEPDARVAIALREAQAHRREGRLQQAHAVLLAVPVEHLGVAPRTRLALARARSLDRQGRRAEALDALNALETTSALAPDGLRAEVALEHVRQGSVRTAATDRHQWLEMAKASLSRAGVDPNETLLYQHVAADLAAREGQHDAATVQYSATCDLFTNATPPMQRVQVLLGYATALRKLARHAEAGDVLERAEAIVQDHDLGRSDVALSLLVARGHQAADAGDRPAGIAILEGVTAAAAAIEGADPNVVGAALSTLGAYYLLENDLDRAFVVLTEAETLVPNFHGVLSNLGMYWGKIPCAHGSDPTACKDNAVAQSNAYQVKAYERARALLGDEHPTIAQLGGNLMHDYVRRGELASADKYAVDTITNLRHAYGDRHVRLLRPLLTTVELRVRQGNQADALKTLAMLEPVFEANRPVVGEAAANVLSYVQARTRIWAGAARSDDPKRRDVALAALGKEPPADIMLIDAWFTGTYVLDD